MGRNSHKATFIRANVPQLFDAQNRGFTECNVPFTVLASTTETKPYFNDVTGLFLKRALNTDTVDFKLEFNGTTITKLGTSVYFPNTPLCEGFIIDWRQHLALQGAGCYTVKVDAVIAGVTIQYTYGVYDLMPWNIDTAMHTVRLYSKFDSYALNYDVNFKGSGFVDSIRFNGFFGRMKPNTVVNNLHNVDHILTKTTRENSKTYELKTDLLNYCHTKRIIDLHLLHENDVFVSDHNPQNHSYDYRDIHVIVDEVGEPEYKDSTRGAVISAIFKDKQPYYRSLYMSGDPLANVTPAPTCSPASWTLEDSLGNTLDSGTINSGVSDTITAPDVDLEINSVAVDSFPSGSTIDVQLTDGTNPVNPTSVTVVGNVVTAQVAAATPAVNRSTATTPRTGAVTVYRTGDDADTRNEGRPTDFLTLDAAPVHNDGSPTINLTTNRFTDINGLQVYGDNIVLDWDTWNGSTLLGWDRRDNGGTGVNINWPESIDAALIHTNGGFVTGWRLANILEHLGIFQHESTVRMNYAPFNKSIGYTYWTATNLSTGAFQINNANTQHGFQPKTSSNGYRFLPVRQFSLSTSNILS